MKNSFLSIGTFLFVLLFSTASNANVPLYQINGKWVSENARTSSIATINISQEVYQFYVQIAESCRATFCYWGKLKAKVVYGRKNKAKLSLKHRKGNQMIHVTIVPLTKNRIKVVTKTVFLDKSGRKPIRKKAYFKRTAMSRSKTPRNNQHQF